MEERRAPFAPVERIEGYLPIKDHGLIGDGTTAGLVGRDGAVSWLCLPRFDAPPVFCRILDAARGGAFTVSPQECRESRQYYLPGSGVLVTEMKGARGTVRLTDCLTLRAGADLGEDTAAGRGELLRLVEVLQGEPRLLVEVGPRGGARAEPRAGGLELRLPGRRDLGLHLSANRPLEGLRALLPLRRGDRLELLLCWGPSPARHRAASAEQLLRNTLDAWRRWLESFRYEGPQERLVRRSALTLKLLDYFPTGAIVASPTSSLPEAIGGPRNWDYRYSWIRDAAFSVYALRRIGLGREAWSFLAWVLDAVERGGRPRVLYDLDGRLPPPEELDAELEGYRRSRPVRWGNAAADQVQHDVFGEIVDCAYQWAMGGGGIEERLWARLRGLVEAAAAAWRAPDQGIWEVRTPGRPFTYSAALCHVALDRAAELSKRFGLPGDAQRWRRTARTIRRAILEEAWDPQRESLTESLGGGALDASLLTLPLRRVLRSDHPRMKATTEAIRRELDAGGGLLHRYRTQEYADGLSGPEGAFLLCSFWLVDNLANQYRFQEAVDLYDRLCGLAGPLGLLPEQVDPSTGQFLGNYPQGFSHIGLISSGFNLARRLRQAPAMRHP